jgi:hypothetical protein
MGLPDAYNTSTDGLFNRGIVDDEETIFLGFSTSFSTLGRSLPATRQSRHHGVGLT